MGSCSSPPLVSLLACLLACLGLLPHRTHGLTWNTHLRHRLPTTTKVKSLLRTHARRTFARIKYLPPMQQTYRRLASTATSTSRSASSSMHHQSTHLSRSSSTTSSAVSPTASSLTPVSSVLSDSNSSFGRMSSMAVPMRNTSYGTSSSAHRLNQLLVNVSLSAYHCGLQSPLHTASPPSEYTRAELETIAESLLAHVHFGPYHLASSPVPSSHLRHAMSSSSSTKENTNLNLSSSSASINANTNTSSTTPTLGQLGRYEYGGPSSRRHFEGKEGSERSSNNHHPRARFTIGAESERGRGMARKSVGLSVRDVTNDFNEFGLTERGRRDRENRGRSGSVKGLQDS